MEASHRYLVIFNLSESADKAAFYETLRSIDSRPRQVIVDAVYGVKSGFSVSEIFRKLSATLSLKDDLLVVEIIKKRCEIKSQDFKHWFDY